MSLRVKSGRHTLRLGKRCTMNFALQKNGLISSQSVTPDNSQQLHRLRYSGRPPCPSSKASPKQIWPQDLEAARRFVRVHLYTAGGEHNYLTCASRPSPSAQPPRYRRGQQLAGCLPSRRLRHLCYFCPLVRAHPTGCSLEVTERKIQWCRCECELEETARQLAITRDEQDQKNLRK